MYADSGSGKLLSAQTSLFTCKEQVKRTSDCTRWEAQGGMWREDSPEVHRFTCAGHQGYAWENASQDTSSRSYFRADTGFVRVVHRHLSVSCERTLEYMSNGSSDSGLVGNMTLCYFSNCVRWGLLGISYYIKPVYNSSCPPQESWARIYYFPPLK